jgi:hypothetical protein
MVQAHKGPTMTGPSAMEMESLQAISKEGSPTKKIV